MLVPDDQSHVAVEDADSLLDGFKGGLQEPTLPLHLALALAESRVRPFKLPGARFDPPLQVNIGFPQRLLGALPPPDLCDELIGGQRELALPWPGERLW